MNHSGHCTGNIMERIKKLDIWTSRQDKSSKYLPPTPLRRSHAKTASQIEDKKDLSGLHATNTAENQKYYCISCHSVVEEAHKCKDIQKQK